MPEERRSMRITSGIRLKRKVKTMSGKCDKCKKTRVIALEICPYYMGKKRWEWKCQEVANGKECKL